jgi:hypothetical protein
VGAVLRGQAPASEERVRQVADILADPGRTDFTLEMSRARSRLIVRGIRRGWLKRLFASLKGFILVVPDGNGVIYTRVNP